MNHNILIHDAQPPWLKTTEKTPTQSQKTSHEAKQLCRSRTLQTKIHIPKNNESEENKHL